MPTQVVIIGSNIDRERSIARVIDELREGFGRVWISRIVETEPLGLIDGGGPFLNLAAAFEWPGSPEGLKARLNSIEERLGRRRDQPDSPHLSRTADIDPLLEIAAGTRALDPRALPAEPYARGVVIDLLRFLGIDTGETPSPALRPFVIEHERAAVGGEPRCFEPLRKGVHQ